MLDGEKGRATICDKIAFTYTLECLGIQKARKKTLKSERNNFDGISFSLDDTLKLELCIAALQLNKTIPI